MGQCNSCNAEYDDDTSTFADATKAPEKALIGTPKPREAPRIRKLNGGKTKPKIKAPSFNISHPIGTPYVEPGVHTLDLKLEPLYCKITSDEQHILVSQRDCVTIFKTATGKRVRELAIKNVSKFVVSEDSSFFIIPYSNVAFFICSFSKEDAPNKPGHPPGVHGILKEISGVGKLFPANIAISSDSTLVLTSNDAFEMRVWQLQWNDDGSLEKHSLIFTSVLHIGRVLSIYISCDNSYAVTTARDCRTLVWSLETGVLARSIAHEVPNDVMLVEEGRRKFLVCWSELGMIRHIAVKSGEVLFQVKLDTSLHLDYMKVSPDYSYLLAGSFTHDIDVYDLQTDEGEFEGKARVVLEGHACPIICYAIAPSCTFVISIGKDEQLFIWDVCNGTRWGEGNLSRKNTGILEKSNSKWQRKTILPVTSI